MNFSEKVNGQRVHDTLKKHNIRLDLAFYGNTHLNCGCYIGVCFYDEFDKWLDESPLTINDWLNVHSAFLVGFNAAILPEHLLGREGFFRLYSPLPNFYEIKKYFDEGFAEGERVHREYLQALNEDII